MSKPLFSSLLVLVLAQLCLSQVPSRQSDAIYPGAVPVDASGDPTHRVFCVIDHRTRRPIADARVARVAETLSPLSGQFWSSFETRTDTEGFARIRAQDWSRGGWLFVLADGYAACAEMSMGGSLIELHKGVTVPFELRDFRNRPVSGAQLGLFVGCGHTPDVRTAKTDARGRGSLQGIKPGEGDLWPVGETLLSDYVDGPSSAWRKGDPITIIHCEPSEAVRGRVVDRNGKALAKMYVGAPRRHRGPWAETDADGRFTLLGAALGTDLEIKDSAGKSIAWIAQNDITGDLVVDSLKPKDAQPADASKEEPKRVIHVKIEGLDEGDDIRFRAVRRADGFADFDLSYEGSLDFELPAGEYDFYAGERHGKYAPAQAFAKIPASDQITLTLKKNPVKKNPVILFAMVGPSLGHGIDLIAGNRVMDIADAVALGDPIPVPPDGELALRLRIGSRMRVIPIPIDARGSGEPFSVAWPDFTVIRFSVAAPDGSPSRAWACFAGSDEADDAELKKVGSRETFELMSWSNHAAEIIVTPEDPKFAPIHLRCTPHESRLVLDLGEQRLRYANRATLRVLDAEGFPYTGEIEIERGVVQLDEAGETRVWIDPDSEVVIPGVGALAKYRTRLGAGQTLLKLPDTRLEIRAEGENGRRLKSFVVIVDGEMTPVEGGLFRRDRLALGTHTIVVVAQGYAAQIFDFDQKTGQQRLSASLPRR